MTSIPSRASFDVQARDGRGFATEPSVASQSTPDRATVLLIRRVLCAHKDQASADDARIKSVEELLPPLTSSAEVDLELYALLAILIRDHVFPWYGKITPDHDFVDEIIRIFAHLTRALEQRLRAVDVETLVFDEIPLRLNSHIDGISALSPLGTGR